MADPNELIAIVERILNGCQDEEDIALRAVLQEQTHRSNITPRRRLGNSPQLALTSALVLPAVSFAFEVVTINSKGRELQRKQAYAQQYIEDLERKLLQP